MFSESDDKAAEKPTDETKWDEKPSGMEKDMAREISTYNNR